MPEAPLQQTPQAPPMDLVLVIETTLRVVFNIMREARESGNPKLALLAAHRVSALTELLANIRGELSHDAHIAIHLAPEFQAMQRTLLAVLDPHPELRARVARALVSGGNGADRPE